MPAWCAAGSACPARSASRGTGGPAEMSAPPSLPPPGTLVWVVWSLACCATTLYAVWLERGQLARVLARPAIPPLAETHAWAAFLERGIGATCQLAFLGVALRAAGTPDP